MPEIQGWIKLHRQLYEWEWYQDSKTVHLWIHMLIKANHKANKWRGITINPGQFITSREKLSIETGISVQSIRSILNRLKSTSNLTIESTNKYTMVSICNWETYQIAEDGTNQQINQQSNNQSTSNQPATNQQLTTNKNDKNVENEKVYRAFDHLSISINEFEKLLVGGYSRDQIDDILDSIENCSKNKKYKSLFLTAKNWLRRGNKDEDKKIAELNLSGPEWNAP